MINLSTKLGLIKDKNIFNFYLPIILFKISLDFLYVNFIYELFSYSGFDLNISLIKYIESFGWLILLGMFLPKRIDRPAQLIVYLFYFIVIIPTLSYYCLADMNGLYFYCMLFQFFVVLKVSGVSKVQQVNTFLVPIKNGTRFLLIISQMIVFGTLVFVAVKSGGRLNFDLNLVYEFREDVTSAIGKGFMSYLVVWTVKVFNVLLMVWFLRKKSYIKASLYILIQILFFGFLAQKSILFSPFLLILTYFIFEKINHKLRFLSVFFVLLMVAVNLYHYYGGDILITSIIGRRLFFVPVMLNFVYYDFFSQNEFIYLSNSIFSWLFHYPYDDLTTSVVIGKYLNTGSSANTGFLATSYMHFGFVGVVIFPVIVGGLLKLLDQICIRIPAWIGAGVTLIPFLSLIQSSDLFTSIFTHGILISFIALWFFSDISKEKKIPG